MGEKFSFKSILYLSTLNSFQIFTYIPSHLFILSFCLFIIHLKSKNELIIIKEYIELKKLFLIIFPILALFTFIEIKKRNFSTNIEKIKSNLISSKNLGDTKILISEKEIKKNILFSVDMMKIMKLSINILSFEILNQTIYRGEISTNLNLKKIIFLVMILQFMKIMIFKMKILKKLFENFLVFGLKTLKQ